MTMLSLPLFALLDMTEHDRLRRDPVALLHALRAYAIGGGQNEPVRSDVFLWQRPETKPETASVKSCTVVPQWFRTTLTFSIEGKTSVFTVNYLVRKRDSNPRPHQVLIRYLCGQRWHSQAMIRSLALRADAE